MSGTPLDRVLARFPRERTWLLPALQAVQGDRGWLSLEDLAAVSAYLRVPKSEVYGVATHYPELRLAPRGTHLVRVCTGVPCRINGGLALLAALEQRFGVAAGETTADRAVTIEEADCCFVCSVAPVVEVDHAYLSNPSPDAVTQACRGEHSPWGGYPPDGSPTTLPQTPSRGGPSSGAGQTATARLAALVAEARARARPGLRLLVSTGSCGRAHGAAETTAALRGALTTAGVDAEVGEGACNGLCYAAPVVEVLGADGTRLTVERVTPARIPALLRLLGGATDHG
ncbi:MAG: NAD(P)H-dependent oxidoreductase subunit E, partial [Candidatus Rokuibacteriota bacterium]